MTVRGWSEVWERDSRRPDPERQARLDAEMAEHHLRLELEAQRADDIDAVWFAEQDEWWDGGRER